jgi:integrase
LRVGTPIEPNAIAQAVRKKLQIFDEPWTPHDLRRTAATGMSGLGVLPHIIEATLNHVSGFRAGVAGVYNRNQFEPEKRRALDIWAAHIADVLAGEDAKIIAFKAR